eukprot:gene16999-23270_t
MARFYPIIKGIHPSSKAAFSGVFHGLYKDLEPAVTRHSPAPKFRARPTYAAAESWLKDNGGPSSVQLWRSVEDTTGSKKLEHVVNEYATEGTMPADDPRPGSPSGRGSSPDRTGAGDGASATKR